MLQNFSSDAVVIGIKGLSFLKFWELMFCVMDRISKPQIWYTEVY